jgi:dihydroorotate dehydrogenase
VRALAKPRPLLVKLAPDLTPEALDEAVDVAIAAGVSGIVATNTTISRPPGVVHHPRAAELGGLSGAPLTALSTEVIRRVAARSAGRVPVIGVGGILEAEDAYAKIRAGASLVQAYTGFIYGGPLFARHIVDGLAKLLARDGFTRIEDAVGADHRTPSKVGIRGARA